MQLVPIHLHPLWASDSAILPKEKFDRVDLTDPRFTTADFPDYFVLNASSCHE